MSAPDLAGLFGVLLILIAYAGGVTGKLHAERPPALLLNLGGALLILLSLAYAPNVSAIVMESAWALVAVFGLVRVALKRRA